jgi:hypothetical protein|tara:strand:+ start:707 stop:1348 length:642 start_codon:yes stop_codon:yes gene_type:complete
MKSIKIGKQEWNKIVRLCLVKCTDGKGSYTYKIEGALFIVHILNSSKAFGYHLKKQGGQTLGEYNLVINANYVDVNYKKIEVTSDDVFDEKCKCGSGYLMKDCCLNFEWTTDLYDLDSGDFISAFLNKNECKEINNLILKMRSKYMIAEYNINENGSNIIGFSCPKMFEKNLTEFDNMFWLEVDEFLESEFKSNKIDIENVSGKVPGNMLFSY